MRSVKIGGACLNQIPMDWDNNLRNIQQSIEEAKEQGIKILCLPELSITGYGCEDMFLSQWLVKKAQSKLTKIIPHTGEIAVAVGLPILFEKRIYNATCFIHNKKILGFYTKQKLANDGVHYEPRWFTPWPSGITKNIMLEGETYPIGHLTFNLWDINIGFEICEDAWRHDRTAYHDINKSVDLFLNPSASHFAFGKARFRENLVIESSEKLDCVYLYANLLGNESGRMIYDGDILIAQKGNLKARKRRLSFKDYQVLACDINFDAPTKTEIKIEEDFSKDLEEFGQAASLALFDYKRKSRSKGFVLSLSGGADSSCIAILVAEILRNGLSELSKEALGKKLGIDIKENDTRADLTGKILQTAYQGTKNSSNETFESAKALAESIGARFYHWNIDDEVNSYVSTLEKAIGRNLDWNTDDIALQNIQARSRSPIIWILANISGALLLSTSNRSEGDVGYATMDGDTSGSISPIAAVSKSFILKWLKYAEKDLGYEGLSYVNRLTPTAELRPSEMNQTDEEDLMPYATLAEIEKLAILEKMSPTQIFDELQYGFSDKVLLKSYLKKFFKLWSINQWKRERIAPSFHLDEFNIDPRTWCRFPILSSGFQEELTELDKR